MPFFQNVFDSDFVGCLVLGDRQLSLNFRVRANTNTTTDMVAWNREPYNLSGNTNLTLNYSLDSGGTWAALTINVSAGAADVTAVTCAEVAAALNADATFAALYDAYVVSEPKAGNFLKIRARRARERWKHYFSNTSAESKLRFNKKAGVAELPTYFSRHTIANVDDFDSSVGMLVELSNPVAGVDVAIVTEAGLSTTVREDWQLLEGRSGLFTFKKITVDGDDRITEIIEYPAGAAAGDFAKLTAYTYTSSNKNPDQITEVPYVLAGGDLVTP